MTVAGGENIKTVVALQLLYAFAIKENFTSKPKLKI